MGFTERWVNPRAMPRSADSFSARARRKRGRSQIAMKATTTVKVRAFTDALAARPACAMTNPPIAAPPMVPRRDAVWAAAPYAGRSAALTSWRAIVPADGS